MAVHRLRDDSYGVVGIRFPDLYVASIRDIPTSVETGEQAGQAMQLEAISGSRQLRVQGNSGEDIRVSLVDMVGRLVLCRKVAAGMGWVSLEGFPPGAYVAVAESAGGRKSIMISLY